MNQKQAIYQHLMTGESINPLQALDWIGCFALSQRCGELRRHHDVPVQSKIVYLPNGKHHAIYWLDKDYIKKVKAGEIKAYY